jgi:hypothetical protein
MDTLQQRFHIEPLLIMLSINSVPAFRPESLPVFVSLTCCRRQTAIKEVTRVHVAAAGTPSSSPPCQDLFDTTTAILGLLHRRRRCTRVGTSSMQPPRSLHRCRRRSATGEEGAPVRKRPNLTPSCCIATFAPIHRCPDISTFSGPGSARSP